MIEKKVLLFAAGENYLGPLWAALASLRAHIKITQDVFVLLDHYPGASHAMLANNFKDRFSIKWIPVLDGVLRRFHVAGHFRASNYLRLFAGELPCDDTTIIIYCDADVMFCEDIRGAADLISDFAKIGVVQEAGIPFVSSPGGVFNWNELGVAPKTKYFNSGLLIFKMGAWRRGGWGERAIDYLLQHGEKASYDQGALNAVLAEKTCYLPRRWNVTTSGLSLRRVLASGGSIEEWYRTILRPAMLHFTGAGSQKPWILPSAHPFAARYAPYLREVPIIFPKMQSVMDGRPASIVSLIRLFRRALAIL